MNAQIAHNFKYHPPTGTGVVAHERIRAKARELADLIDEIVPVSCSDEKEIAIVKVQEVMMWACAGIARHWQEPPPPISGSSV